MADTWGSSWGTSWGNSWGSTVTPPVVVTRTQGDPGGYDEQSRKRAEEFAALRAIAERQARRVETVVDRPKPVVQQPKRAKPPEPVKLEPAPTLLVQMGKVAIGIKTPSLTEVIEAQILADDEDAITAILLAAQ